MKGDNNRILRQEQEQKKMKYSEEAINEGWFHFETLEHIDAYQEYVEWLDQKRSAVQTATGKSTRKRNRGLMIDMCEGEMP